MPVTACNLLLQLQRHVKVRNQAYLFLQSLALTS